MSAPLPAHDVVRGCAEELRMGGDSDEPRSEAARVSSEDNRPTPKPNPGTASPPLAEL